MEMGVSKTDEEMGKVNPRCDTRLELLKNWLLEILN
jgi:hypothetical protein